MVLAVQTGSGGPLHKANTKDTYPPHMTDEQTMLLAHLRSIRTALVAVAVSVLATGLIIRQDPLGFPFFLASLLVCAYAFVPPLLRG